MMTKRLQSQRGSSLLIATLAMLALIVASTGAMVTVIVAHSQRVSHQARGVQALYLAEMGVEEMLAARGAGEDTTSIRRTIPRLREAQPTGEGLSEMAAGSGLDETSDVAAVVGSYAVTAGEVSGKLEIRSEGVVPTPAGRSVARVVRVTCNMEGDRWVPTRWEQVPMAPPAAPGNDGGAEASELELRPTERRNGGSSREVP